MADIILTNKAIVRSIGTLITRKRNDVINVLAKYGIVIDKKADILPIYRAIVSEIKAGNEQLGYDITELLVVNKIIVDNNKQSKDTSQFSNAIATAIIGLVGSLATPVINAIQSKDIAKANLAQQEAINEAELIKAEAEEKRLAAESQNLKIYAGIGIFAILAIFLGFAIYLKKRSKH